MDTGGIKVGIGVFTCMEVGKKELPEDDAFRVDCPKGEGVRGVEDTPNPEGVRGVEDTPNPEGVRGVEDTPNPEGGPIVLFDGIE